MMNDKLKTGLTSIKTMLVQSLRSVNSLAAMLENPESDPAMIAVQMDKLCARFEKGVIEMRNLCESERPNVTMDFAKPPLPNVSIAGSVGVHQYGWLHIELNALLPHCRFQTPSDLTDTIIRLLDAYEAVGNIVPRYEDAILVIDEHCDILARRVYDQDNKGWKAVPNAIKGRVVRDDDQFTLEIALLSTVCDEHSCHIYILPQADAGEFFLLRNDGCL
jgi:hypothetical protein